MPPLATIGDSTFMLVWNGVRDSPPAGPVRDFLLAHRARRVTTVVHPLEPEDGTVRAITSWEWGERIGERALRLPSRPPFTYALDPFVPLRPATVDCWIGFNNLAAARGLVHRRLGRAGRVLYWAVDFVPDRFGRSVLTRIYDSIDAYCSRAVDLRVELSQAALEGRNHRHRLDGRAAPAAVAPVGAWTDRVPATPDDGWRTRRVLYLGHLVPRQGVTRLVEALALLRRRGTEFTAEIAGHGPLEEELRSRVGTLGLGDRVLFRGFLSGRDLEQFLASGSVGVAPYDTGVNSFTRYADPSKLRAYAAAGLPIVLTDVPPNAHDLAANAGAEVVPYDAEALAAAIEHVLSSPSRWSARRAAALAYARRYDWNVILSNTFEAAGFAPPSLTALRE
jgi:glycosyltransferase involved in cell wall biosynthesis